MLNGDLDRRVEEEERVRVKILWLGRMRAILVFGRG